MQFVAANAYARLFLRPAARKPLFLLRPTVITGLYNQVGFSTLGPLGAKKSAPPIPEPSCPSTSPSPSSLNIPLGASSAIKKDLGTFKEFFGDVPKEAMVVGLAGTLPYLATSVAVLGLSWNYHRAAQGINDIFTMSPETSEYLIHILQPLQVGYGACIISVLGAIHWGLEFAEYGGRQGYNRYVLGVLSTVLAWPTVLLPFSQALIVQFLGFTGLWYADVNATRYGWAPPWYMTYRFLLTFIVCTSIIFTLVIQGWIDPHNLGSVQRLDESRELKHDNRGYQVVALPKEYQESDEQQTQSQETEETIHKDVDESSTDIDDDSEQKNKSTSE